MKIELKGFGQFEREMKYAPKLFEKAFKRAFTESGELVKTYARKNAPVDTGNLKRSINYKVKKTEVRIGPNARYGVYVEDGTRPHYVKPKRLKKWASRKGLDPQLVAWAIAKHGTKAQPFLGPAIKDSSKHVFGFFEDAIKAVLKKIAR